MWSSVCCFWFCKPARGRVWVGVEYVDNCGYTNGAFSLHCFIVMLYCIFIYFLLIVKKCRWCRRLQTYKSTARICFLYALLSYFCLLLYIELYLLRFHSPQVDTSLKRDEVQQPSPFVLCLAFHLGWSILTEKQHLVQLGESSTRLAMDLDHSVTR